MAAGVDHFLNPDQARRAKMRRIHCFKVLQIGAALLVFFLLSSPTLWAAETYPNRPINLILGFTPGSSTELISRAIAECASQALGQPIAMVFKPGGGSSVSLSLLKGEKPDGYTIGFLAVGGVRAAILQKVPYDPLEDFTHLIQIGEYQLGMGVVASSPWKTMEQFVEYAKSNPGKIRYGSPGVSTGGNLGMQRLALDLGIKWSNVPYEGDSQVIAALLGGHVDAGAGSAGGWKDYVDAGKIKLLSLFLEKRAPNLPEVPTLMEQYKIFIPGPIGFVAPKGLPEQMAVKLHDTFRQCMEGQAFIKAAQRFGISPVYRNGQDFKQYLRKMLDDESKLFEKIGLKK